ncbi:hypothetical protein VD659_04380 [Herbiconiux sp. 11R-BC]|uniref:sensor histidine kinase n=1 Tax=Herbiconiux sp. 11R-BC TaxID=3111637 RepID=UPI003C0DB219
MSSLTERLNLFIEPVIGVVFLLLWINAEVGRTHEPGFFIGLGLYAVAIAVCRLLPVVSLAIIGGVPLLQLAGVLSAPESTTWPIYEAALVVGFVVALSATSRIRWAALAVGAVQAVTVGIVLVWVGDWASWTGGMSLLLLGVPLGAAQLAIGLMVLGGVLYLLAWGAGAALHAGSRRRAERQALAEAEAALVAADFELRSVRERSELAQEVHDVLAHSLTVVVAVADGSRYLRASGAAALEPSEPGELPEQDAIPEADAVPEQTDEALRRIADTARSALTDLRGLLEGLHDDGTRPQPGLAEVDALVERVSLTGMTVQLERLGEPGMLTPAQELSVYRIVQESLTNALKHGGSRPAASVSLAWGGDGLVLTVTSAACAVPEAGAAATAGRTFGIRGMTDRARLAGGWLTAARDEEEGVFVVTASIPFYEAAERRAAGVAA